MPCFMADTQLTMERKVHGKDETAGGIIYRKRVVNVQSGPVRNVRGKRSINSHINLELESLWNRTYSTRKGVSVTPARTQSDASHVLLCRPGDSNLIRDGDEARAVEKLRKLSQAVGTGGNKKGSSSLHQEDKKSEES